MTARRGRRRKHQTPEDALAALRKSQKRYEGSEAGKKRKADYVDRHREEVNAYKRKWRKSKREKQARAGIRVAAF